jgi:hypothetical protein
MSPSMASLASHSRAGILESEFGGDGAKWDKSASNVLRTEYSYSVPLSQWVLKEDQRFKVRTWDPRGSWAPDSGLDSIRVKIQIIGRVPQGGRSTAVPDEWAMVIRPLFQRPLDPSILDPSWLLHLVATAEQSLGAGSSSSGDSRPQDDGP